MDKSKKTKNKEKRTTAVFSLDIPFKDDMTDFEVEDQFCKLMEEMNLSADKRVPLLSKSIAEKRLIIAQTHNSIDNSPAKYVHGLTNILERRYPHEKVIKKLDSLRVYLSSSPLSMVKEFNDENNKGLSLLVEVLAMYLDNPENALMCLKCIRAFGNCGYGLLTLINSKEALLHVALCLNHQSPNLMLLALELLTLFTFYSFNSHTNVMEVLYLASRIRDHEERFSPIVDGLSAGVNDQQSSLILPCLQFINVIVSPNFKDTSTCSNLESMYSMHLRIEFVRCGLNTVLDKIVAGNPSEMVQKNITVFQSDTEYEDDYQSKIDIARSCLQDRDTVYGLLARSVAGTDCDRSLTSVLKHLLVVKDNPIRTVLYRLIDDVVAEIVIHSDGICPDPMLNQLDSYNLTDLFDKFADPKNGFGFEFQDKFDRVLGEKHEAEAKLHCLENKLGPAVAPPPPAPVAPPPPPPPGTGAPPPPPPGPGAPPPPPTAKQPNNSAPSLPFGMQIKTIVKPKVPMKKANWTKVDTKLLEKTSVWKTINDDTLANLPDALNDLAEKFSTKQSIKADDSSSTGSQSSVSLHRKIKEYKVLDGKSGQNLGILSGSLKVPHQEIKRRLMELDESLLSQTNVENLVKNLPTTEQLKMLSNLTEDFENLNEAEQFGCILASIKGLQSRLNCLLFKMKFNERVAEIKPAIICGTESLREVKNSQTLPKILELVLQFGNFMNDSSKTSLTVGFHLSFLTKLTGTKDNSGESTLMEFLVAQIRSRFPALLNIVGELSYLDKASRISMESINGTIAEMKAMKTILERDLKTYTKQAENDNFVPIMKEFLDCVTVQLDLMTEMNSKLQQEFHQAAKYFSFDPIKYPMEEFFHDMKQFKDDFQKSVSDIEASVQLRERRKKAQEDKAKRETAKVKQQQMKATREEDDGVLDNLCELLNSGDAYGNVCQNRNKGKKRDKLHIVNRSRSRREFNLDLIPA